MTVKQADHDGRGRACCGVIAVLLAAIALTKAVMGHKDGVMIINSTSTSRSGSGDVEASTTHKA